MSAIASLDPHVRGIIEDAAAADDIPFRARTSHLHATWARTFASLPELYIQPQSQQEVEKAVKLARRCRRRITTVGHAHSPSDLTCTSNWLVNLDDFKKVLSVDETTGLVVMQAGIRLWQLTEELNKHGLSFPVLGSVNEQTIAGVISTGTRGSTLKHGLLSEAVTALKIVLASGETVACSPAENPDLFRGALLSLGALGIITEVTFRAVPAFSLRWQQTIQADATMLGAWKRDNELWTQSDFVRVWWLPYTRRAVVWRADVVTKEDLESGREKNRDPPVGYYDGALGYHIYHNLLYLSRYVPRILPWVEWFVFGMQYGFKNGYTSSAVQPMDKALWMNCLFSQYVNEWAIPLHRGPEALMRLGSWINKLQPGDPDYVAHGIPYSAEGLYIHSPVEVRVCDATVHTSAGQGNRPFLDSTVADGPTLNLNATMYRPYDLDPPGLRRWFQGFEWLMRDLGGRPHWAKNFDVRNDELAAWYGDDLARWRRLRDDVDPDGLFVGPWHRQFVLDPETAPLAFEEVEEARHDAGRGVTVYGTRARLGGEEEAEKA
ncbi:putative D-arabinono-1,4-lactone oxidase [Colletotrichum tanaceti]|uniref:D-arabinono-1,4-lactone oxidase n=1 Tax=Colletotrichum tanaceti TaxID=1306861 RepID=A0A4U6X3V5_9PEZI|nr:putative D-arabinono-1,4-lactone oxidase [Colletotrichum tanaceti]TKW49845.1 putative D-arabinono-1,4-lactone oxidase [Colletotrichum tanaceti]